MRALLALVLCAALAATTEDTDSKWSLKGTSEVARVPQNVAHQYRDDGWVVSDELEGTHSVVVEFPRELMQKVVGQHQITYNLVLRSDPQQTVGNPKYRVVEVIDWNECEGAEDPCPVNSECKNTIGSYECLCPSSGLDPAVWTPSYTNEGFLIACHRKDICADDSARTLCDYKISRCINTDFGYECVCNEGYEHPGTKRSDKKKCIDIDECQRDPTICNSTPHSHCVNTVGSSSCHCDEGFYRTSDHQCKLIETCPSNHKCSEKANCKYINGKESCICADGYEGDGHTCTDINECEREDLNNCRGNSSCKNEVPDLAGDSITGLTVVSAKFLCQCPAGYKLKETNKTMECEDVDECVEFGTKCPPRSHCVNTVGNYTCKCNFSSDIKDGIHCFPRDEPVLTLLDGDEITHQISIYQYQSYEECGYILNENYTNAEFFLDVETPTPQDRATPGMYEVRYKTLIRYPGGENKTDYYIRKIKVEDINECDPQPLVPPCQSSPSIPTLKRPWKECDPIAKCYNLQENKTAGIPGFGCICPPHYFLNTTTNQCEDKRPPKLNVTADSVYGCKVCGEHIKPPVHNPGNASAYDEIPLPVDPKYRVVNYNTTCAENANTTCECYPPWDFYNHTLPAEKIKRDNNLDDSGEIISVTYTATDNNNNDAIPETVSVRRQVIDINADIDELFRIVQNNGSVSSSPSVPRSCVSCPATNSAVVPPHAISKEVGKQVESLSQNLEKSLQQNLQSLQEKLQEVASQVSKQPSEQEAQIESLKLQVQHLNSTTTTLQVVLCLMVLLVAGVVVLRS